MEDYIDARRARPVSVSRGWRVAAGFGLCCALASALAWNARPREWRATQKMAIGLARDCGNGLVREREGPGEWECQRARHPETFAEFNLMQSRRRASVSAPYNAMPRPEAFNAAVAEREAMKSAVQSKAAAAISNADSAWSVYGTPILDANTYSSVSGEGYIYNSGRIDSFDYDPVGKRLFASLGTGGIWMSLDKGTTWKSVGETLPSQVVGAVGWSSFGGKAGSGSNGTIVVASGDPSFGGGDYAGLGAFWSDNLGVTWHMATGVPAGVLGFKVAVDHKNPNIVYLGLSKGLFRSTDGGRSYANVKLPTSATCAGVTDVGSKCQFANFVTDVVVMEPGGSTNEAGGKVLAAVGYRAGNKVLADNTVSSPGNGLYASADGTPGSFAKLNNSVANNALPNNFPPQDRIGRIALGQAYGTAQNHNYLYAMVQDAVLFNGGFPTLDLPEPAGSTVSGTVPVPVTSTLFNGLYISGDFGQSWTRAADTNEIVNNPATGSAIFIQNNPVLQYAPGIQAYYNLYVKPSPVSTDALTAAPTSLVFGLEEVWANTLPVAQNGTLQSGPSDYQVIGVYNVGTSTSTAVSGGTTVHADQHAAIWIPDDDGAGGATLVVGDDGGAFTQHVASGAQPVQSAWGNGSQTGFNTLLPYGISVAKDGTVWFGLQDNGSGKVTPDGKYFETYGGDGFYVTVDPNNSNYAWEEYTYADMRYTTDGGNNWTSKAPTLTGAAFDNLFVLDPTDAKHMMTAANEVVELTNAPTGSWTQVFSLGNNAKNSQANTMSSLDLQGDSAYVGFCGICDLLNRTQYQFYNGLATNVGGSKPAKRGTSDGWHFAGAKGLPNRFIQAIEIDPADPKTVYIALGGYANRQWVPPGSYLDTNTNIGAGHVFKSVDAGENFIDISGNLPDANATALLLRKGQLLVGMDVGIFISDGVAAGAQWAPMMNGMPNVPIGQFQLRPGNDSEVFVATYGRAIYHATFADKAVVVTPTPGTGTVPVITPTPSTVGSVQSQNEGRFGGGALGALTLLPLALAARRRRQRRR